MKRLQNVIGCHVAKPCQDVTVCNYSNLLQFVIVWTVALTFGACCPCRHLTTSSADNVRVETHTRTEYVRDTVFVDVPAESTAQTVTTDYSHLETKFAVSDARIESDGRLFHSLWNKALNAPVAVETPVIYRDSIVYRDRIVNNVVEVERELTAWQRFQMRGFWVLFAVAMCIIMSHIKYLFNFHIK